MQTSEVQWAILGTGQPKYHKLFEGLAQRLPNKVAVRLEFSNPLAHRIEAGSDMFLMPSRFEPCGLNQMYSLRYGTVPIVRETGGLADTIVGYGNPQAPLPPGNRRAGQRIQFPGDSPFVLSETLRRACDLFRLQPDKWKKLIDTGMRQDWSWGRVAKKYVELYLRTAAGPGTKPE